MSQKGHTRDKHGNAICFCTPLQQSLFRTKHSLLLLCLFGVALIVASRQAGASTVQLTALTDLSLEQLSEIEIISVTRRPEKVSDTPASAFVITNEDIRRSGATTLPEALRLAPNLQVAQIGSNSYAISARGFNNSLGNKLLVMIDGRTVYTPLYSGVFWDQQNVMLEDVERIEVISGPAGTTWGTNAVNGVINVITRRAADTQGGLAAIGSGDHRSSGAFRYGGKFGNGGAYRVYGQGFNMDTRGDPTTNSLSYDWQNGQAGFRSDWSDSNQSIILQGDFYSGRSDERRLSLGLPLVDSTGPLQTSGMNLLARWKRMLQGGSNIRLQAYYDHTERDDPLLYGDQMDMFDMEFQHAIPLDAHDLLWGIGYRHARDKTTPGTLFSFEPANRNMNWANVFAQDQIRLNDELELTLGARGERNIFTGWEFLPSVRLAWKPTDKQLIWGAYSRAVRAPARIDRDFHFSLPITPSISRRFIVGGPDFESEIADVFELGYRGQPWKSFSYSITAFYNFYDQLRSGHQPPAVIDNQSSGTTSGVEAWATYQVTRDWRLSGGLTLLNKNLELDASSDDQQTGTAPLGDDPDYQWNLRSTFNVSAQHEFDVAVRRVGKLPDPDVPAYTAVDLRLGWRPTSKLDLSLAVRNLFDSEHREFDPGNPVLVGATPEIGRSFFIKAVWQL